MAGLSPLWGDAKFSAFGRKIGRHGRVARSSTVVIVSRIDGAAMSASDIRAAREALARVVE